MNATKITLIATAAVLALYFFAMINSDEEKVLEEQRSSAQIPTTQKAS